MRIRPRAKKANPMSRSLCHRYPASQGERKGLGYLILERGFILGCLLHFAVVAVLDVVKVVLVDAGTELSFLASLGIRLGLGLLEVVLGRLHGSGALRLSSLGPRSGRETSLFLEASDTVLDCADRAVCRNLSVSSLT